MSKTPVDDTNGEGYQDWSHDLDKLQDIGQEILSEWRDENPESPRNYPTVKWLTDNGYSHLRWILDDKHDMGVPEFFLFLTSAGGSEGYHWFTDDVATIQQIKKFLNDQMDCREWKISTKRTNRAQINQTLDRFSSEVGNENILSIIDDPTLETEVYESFKCAIKSLREDLESHDSAYQYVRATHRFIEWLHRSKRIAEDPIKDIEKEFKWNRNSDSKPLDTDQVRRLWIAAETEEERMLVIGYCVWGLRTKELPRVHVDKINLSTDDPSIEFDKDDRKNGTGQVTIMFGLDTLAALVDKYSQQPNWNGFLYPSDADGRSFLCDVQMRRKFKKLSRKANVKIDGEVATPKHGRAFYYNILMDGETELLENLSKMAEEQGAEDPEAIRDHYLTDSRIKKYRRQYFRNHIQGTLPDDIHTEYNSNVDFDSSFDNFEWD